MMFFTMPLLPLFFVCFLLLLCLHKRYQPSITCRSAYLGPAGGGQSPMIPGEYIIIVLRAKVAKSSTKRNR